MNKITGLDLCSVGELPRDDTDCVQDGRETAAGIPLLDLLLWDRGFVLPLVRWSDRHCHGGALRAAGDQILSDRVREGRRAIDRRVLAERRKSKTIHGG